MRRTNILSNRTSVQPSGVFRGGGGDVGHAGLLDRRGVAGATTPVGSEYAGFCGDGQVANCGLLSSLDAPGSTVSRGVEGVLDRKGWRLRRSARVRWILPFVPPPPRAEPQLIAEAWSFRAERYVSIQASRWCVDVGKQCGEILPPAAPLRALTISKRHD